MGQQKAKSNRVRCSSSSLCETRLRKREQHRETRSAFRHLPSRVFHRQLAVGSEMADLQQMSRILYHHDWANVEDWARNVAQLADLSDEEIVQLGPRCTGAVPPGPGARQQSAAPVAPMHASLVTRTRQRVAMFCDGLRVGLRRAC